MNNEASIFGYVDDKLSYGVEDSCLFYCLNLTEQKKTFNMRNGGMKNNESIQIF